MSPLRKVNKIMKRFLLISLLIISSIFSYSQQERKYIREGNKNYAEKAYNNSETEYGKAILSDSSSFPANFNLANAYYKQKKYAPSEKQFLSAVDMTSDKDNLSNTYYNLGNSQLKYSEQILDEGNPQDALNKISQSIESYKNALRNNPNNKEAKYNLSFAKELQKQIQDQLNNQNNNQNQQQNNDQKENKNQGDEENKDRDQGKNTDSDGDGIPDKTEKNEDQAGKQKNPDTDNDGKKDFEDTDSDNDGISDSYEAGDNPEKPKDTDNDGTPDYRDTDSDNDGIPDSEDPDALPRATEISDLDAEKLLQYIIEKEKETLKKVNIKKADAKKVKVDKDW